MASQQLLLLQELVEDGQAQRRIRELEQLLLHVHAQRQDFREAETHPRRILEPIRRREAFRAVACRRQQYRL